MRALAFTSLLVVLGCTTYPPAPPEAPPAAPPSAPPPEPWAPPAPDPWPVRTPSFVGVWRVLTVDGRPTPARQSPILMTVEAGRIRARADCANLGEPSYVVRGELLLVQPPPTGLIGSCVRGLSDYERAFETVFRPGAAARLRDGRLVLDYAGRAVEAMRER